MQIMVGGGGRMRRGGVCSNSDLAYYITNFTQGLPKGLHIMQFIFISIIYLHQLPAKLSLPYYAHVITSQFIIVILLLLKNQLNVNKLTRYLHNISYFFFIVPTINFRPATYIGYILKFKPEQYLCYINYVGNCFFNYN